ncbi:hypothetical protein PGAG_00276 [Phaeocystis globosa virus 12T]|uniref:Uncharacterized protein n=1 Tax=Phaeocystis globosa virus PgV-16T TaxID=3071227 RepID=A0AC59EXA6_9VIRU|nr:hypothetical protein PGCG_00315 [Phaeocystis globosa virus]AET73165.1 hypothetical protein PGAG_00276 [Phaeocystis globosa virus 12T]AET73989.1 hypothetical protein PGBG_00281 [Phaeocystis globosa virus 14T]AGM15626.1 hypothetical protein PGCG_00315 [Phaeocystis globosa virus PgV-16T]UYE94356.1 hypothetical protein PGV14T_00315 [Phaeocystis globosa virus]
MFAIMMNCFTFLTTVLPPKNIIYRGSIVLPFSSVKPIYINYQRIEDYRVEIKLTGDINMVGNIHYDENYKSVLDEQIMNVLDRYSCSLPYVEYDNILDTVRLNIQMELFEFVKPQKNITLRYIEP